MTAFWRQSAYEDQVEEVAPWEGMDLDRDEGDDDVLQAATELVREHGQLRPAFCSASYMWGILGQPV